MALDTIGLIGGPDALHEISMRLEESHLTYLQLDESPLKLQARQKLEGFMKEYLCHVPNERKYVFQETADILHRSAATVKDFSGYRACTAWRALSLYAVNLLAQPWRKEYRTLRTYSGYYKHEIEANLVGAELMFELMGYKHTGLGVLTLEGPIDPDRVSSVSRDAIVAYVECQILNEIWEKVSQKFTVSWLEVLEFRCNSVGTPEQAIRALNFRFLERLHQSREKNLLSGAYRDYIHVQPIGMETVMSGLPPSTIPYPAIPNNYTAAMMPSVCKPESVYPSDGNFYFAPVEATNVPIRCANPYTIKPMMNHCYPMVQPQLANTMTIVPGHVTRVPTGRLIELDPPLPVATTATPNYERNRAVLNEISNRPARSRSHEIDTDDIDYRRNNTMSQRLDDRDDDYTIVEKSRPSVKTRNDVVDATRDDDWEFVYKSLESRGYFNDLGDRDDVLRKKDTNAEARNSARLREKNSHQLIDQDEKYERYYGTRGSARNERKKQSQSVGHFSSKSINFNDFDLEYSNGQENRAEFRKKSSLELSDNAASVLDSTGDKSFSTFDKNGKKYSNTLPSPRNFYKNTLIETTAKSNDSARDNRKQENRDYATGDKWSCSTCTYFNSPEREICEMCDKSRRKGNEDKPLASGGKECPRCTLVNEKNASNCEACSTSLEDSPTYI